MIGRDAETGLAPGGARGGSGRSPLRRGRPRRGGRGKDPPRRGARRRRRSPGCRGGVGSQPRGRRRTGLLALARRPATAARRRRPDADPSVAQLLDATGELSALVAAADRQVLHGVRRLLGPGQRRPVVAVFEDVQWAGSERSNCSPRSSPASSGGPVLLVLTLRDGEDASQPPVVAALGGAAAGRRRRRLGLAGLAPRRHRGRCPTQVHGRPLEGPSRGWSTTGRTGIPSTPSSSFACSGPRAWPTTRRCPRAVPAGVRDVVRQRLARLPSPTVEPAPARRRGRSRPRPRAHRPGQRPLDRPVPRRPRRRAPPPAARRGGREGRAALLPCPRPRGRLRRPKRPSPGPGPPPRGRRHRVVGQAGRGRDPRRAPVGGGAHRGRTPRRRRPRPSCRGRHPPVRRPGGGGPPRTIPGASSRAGAADGRGRRRELGTHQPAWSGSLRAQHGYPGGHPALRCAARRAARRLDRDRRVARDAVARSGRRSRRRATSISLGPWPSASGPRGESDDPLVQMPGYADMGDPALARRRPRSSYEAFDHELSRALRSVVGQPRPPETLTRLAGPLPHAAFRLYLGEQVGDLTDRRGPSPRNPWPGCPADFPRTMTWCLRLRQRRLAR